MKMTVKLPYSKDGLLPTGVTHCPVVFDSGRGRVPDAEVEGAGAAVVGRGPVVPNDNNFLGRLEVAHRAHMAFAAILKR